MPVTKVNPSEELLKLHRPDQEPDPRVISRVWPFISDHTPFPKDLRVAHAVFVECPVGRLMTAVKGRYKFCLLYTSDAADE